MIELTISKENLKIICETACRNAIKTVLRDQVRKDQEDFIRSEKFKPDWDGPITSVIHTNVMNIAKLVMIEKRKEIDFFCEDLTKVIINKVIETVSTIIHVKE